MTQYAQFFLSFSIKLGRLERPDYLFELRKPGPTKREDENTKIKPLQYFYQILFLELELPIMYF